MMRPAKVRPEAQRQRVAAFRLGLSAESRAATLLMAKGYRIVVRRFKPPFGEIDIVARRRNALIFVEVKARDHVDDAAMAVPNAADGALSAPPSSGWRGIPATRSASSALTSFSSRPGKCPGI
jgi:putative endonuclease